MKKILIASLILVPMFCFADTTQDQIASLEQQLITLYTELLQLLQAQQATPVVATVSNIATPVESSAILGSVTAPTNTKTMPPFFYRVISQGNKIQIRSTVDIDPSSFTLGGVSASSSSQWTPPVGNILCDGFNAGNEGMQGCNNTGTLFIYNFNYDTIDNSLPISFTTVDRRTQDVGLQSR